MPLLLGDLPDPYKETLPLSSEPTPVVSIGGASRPAPHQTVNPLRADSECESPLGLPQQSLAYSSNSLFVFSMVGMYYIYQGEPHIPKKLS